MLPNIKTFFFFSCMPKFPCRPPFCSENVVCTVELETTVNQSWSPGHPWKSVTEWPSCTEPAEWLHLGATGTIKFRFGNGQWTRMLSIISAANPHARSLSHDQPWEGVVFLILGTILCFLLKEKKSYICLQKQHDSYFFRNSQGC